MTCIVGLVDNGSVWIGGDSAAVAGLDLTRRADAKVFRNGPFLMGFTSSFRMGQLLQYSLEPPRHHADTPIFQFMAIDFIDAVRQCLKDGGFAENYKDVERGGSFLVGYRSRLFQIDTDYQVGEPIAPFEAIGCGADLAQGAMHASEDENLAKDRMLLALTAAERFSAGVCSPFSIQKLEPRGERADQ